MLKLFSTYLILFNTTLLFAQTVKSKDGVILGERSQFIKSCSHGAEKELMKIKGMEIQTYEYCSCVCDNLIPTINSWDLDKALKENKINELLLIDENLKVLMKCLEGNYKISENYKFTITDSYEEQKNIGISRCITEVLVNDSSGIWTKQTAEEYCDCAIQKLFSKGYTYKEILDIEDENSTTFNEIAVPCVSEVFSKKSKTLAKSKKISEDIEGGTEKCIIPLTDYFGKGYKIKLSLSGIIKYFLLDTGASDIIIDRETERELLIKGILKEDNYLEKTHYSLANNQTVSAQKIKINNVNIGDYTVNNLTVAILDEGSLLCGKSFLDKFSRWEINKEEKVIILYK